MPHLPGHSHNKNHEPRSSSGGSGGQQSREQLAHAFEDEKERIVRSCFSRVDEQNHLLESYITHVRVTEDSYYPSSKPPPTSPDKNKKQRAVIIAVRKSGRVRVHKARENPNGTFQIGKTWNLDDLTKIEGDATDLGAVIMHMGKPYYWVTRSAREKNVFVSSAVKIYKRYTGGRAPELVNIDATGGQSSQNPRYISSDDAPPFHQPQSPGGMPGNQPSSMQSPQLSHPSPLVQTPPIGSSYSFPGSQQQTPPLRPNQAASSTPAGSGSTPSSRLPGEKRNVTPGGPRAPPTEPATASIPIPISMAPPAMPPAMAAAQSPSSVHSASTSHSLPNSERHKRSPSATSKTSNQSFPANLRPTGYVTTQPLKPADDSWQPQSNRQSFHQQRRSVHLDNTNSLELAPTRQRALSNHALLHQSQKSVLSTPAPPVPNTSEIDKDGALFTSTASAIASKSSPNILESIEADAPESNNGQSHTRSRSVLSDVKVFAHSKRTSQVIDRDDEVIIEQENVTLMEFNKKVSERYDEEIEVKEAAIESGAMFNQADTSPNHGNSNKPGTMELSVSRGREHRRDISFSAQSNASAVEETLGEFNWTGRDDVKSLEMTIGKELLELETANTHNVVDLDDRLDEIDHILASAINESEQLDTVLAFFSVQLSAFSEDVKHIESQGKGIQVQTNHQKDLWNELSRILQTVSIPDDALRTLLACRISNTKELASTESALVKLYHGLEISEADGQGDSLAQMRAVQEKRGLYEQARNEFGSRFKQHIESKFKEANAESKSLYSNSEEPVVVRIEGVFMRHLYPFCGILLYLREMDTMTYESVLKMYEYCVQPHYEDAISQYMAKWRKQISMLLTRAEKFSFVNYAKAKAQSNSDSLVSKSLKRSGTLAKFRSNDSKESLSAALSASTSPNLSEDKAVWTPNVKQREQIKAALSKLLDGIAETFISQQELLIQLFHQSSFSEFNFPEFVNRVPISSRQDGESVIKQYAVREVESDVIRGKELFMHMNQIFGSFQDKVVSFSDFFIKNSSLETPYLLALTEGLLSRYEATNQDFLTAQLTRLRDRLVQGWQLYIQQQISAISNTVVSSKKRKGVVYFVKVLPGFCKVIESDLQAIHTPEHPISELPVRRVINETYERIFKEVFRNLQRLAKEPSAIVSTTTTGMSIAGASSEHEDKEQLNYHVMMIENMHVLNEGLMDSSNAVLMSYRGNAIITYKKELEIYINTVLHRPLGKILDFVEGVETLLAKNSRENPSTRSTYSRGNVKRMLAGMDAKEVRKGASTLYARVEKHFWGETEDSHADKDPHLVSKVWNAIEAQYQSTISRLIKILDQYYSDSDGQPASVTLLEFSKQDISAAFNAKR